MNSGLKKKIWGWTSILVILFCLLLVVSVHQPRNRGGHLSWKYYVGNHRHKAVAITDVIYISPWMTFDYINKVFDLPSNYLEQNLQIHDSKYPFVTIQRYSKNSNIDSSVLIESIRKDIKQYVASSSSPL